MSQNSFLHLQTRRLTLRPFALDDTALAARILRNPRVVFWRKKRMPVNDIRKGVKRSVDKLNPYGLGWWLLFEKDSDELVGSIMLQPLANTFHIEIGYHLLPAHWGKGYATEAARLILSFGFQALGLRHIHAVVLARNRPSLGVIGKLGFEQKGTLIHANLVHRNYRLERNDYLAKKKTTS